MLTDIFLDRYADHELWKQYGATEQRLLGQLLTLTQREVAALVLVSERRQFWQEVHDRLAQELGLQTLATPFFVCLDRAREAELWCENFYLAPLKQTGVSADTYIKARLSLIELAFRFAGTQFDPAPHSHPAAKPASMSEDHWRLLQWSREENIAKDAARLASLSQKFDGCVSELNTRLQRAQAGLHYHNGFLQISDDHVTSVAIEEPFWGVVAPPRWSNVDNEMKMALDERDGGRPKSAKYAADALESAIKIISKEKGLTTGKENGAANYIDNLRRGGLLEVWELEMLKAFFKNVRNPQGHGLGPAPLTVTPAEDVDWAIGFCMTWIRLLVRRSGV